MIIYTMTSRNTDEKLLSHPMWRGSLRIFCICLSLFAFKASSRHLKPKAEKFLVSISPLRQATMKMITYFIMRYPDQETMAKNTDAIEFAISTEPPSSNFGVVH